MSSKQTIYVFIFTIICVANAININIFPEFINNYHFAHVANCEIPCEFFEDHENPDAEFYIDNVQSAVDSNSKVPIRILGSNEAQHYYPLLKLEYLKLHFQGSALLDRRSDIPWALILDMDKMKDVPISKDAKPKATFVARNCDPMNGRNDYAKAIGAKIGVVALSSCMNNAKWPDCNGTPCSKVEAIRPYKIHLAFENGDSPGYVSEKIYQAYEAGVLPVWMGTREIAEAVPKGSYIDVAEFNSPDDVANYLKLVLENETLYNSYFEWKNKPFDPEFDIKNRVLWSESVFCRTCYYVDTLQRGLEWDHLRQRAKSTGANSSISSVHLITYLPHRSNPAQTPQQPSELNPYLLKYRYFSEYSSSTRTLTIFILINCILLLLLIRRKSPLRAMLFKLYRK